MRGEILGVERRRHWGDDEKLAIVSAVGVAPRLYCPFVQP